MKARITLLHNTEAEWLKLSTFKPEPGEVVIYDPDDNFDYVRLKIGDGKHFIQDLDFCIDRAIDTILTAQRYLDSVDAGRITEYIK